MQKAIDKVVEMIKEENIIDIRMFTIWFKRMFRQKVNIEESDKIKNLMEVKNMLTAVAQDIEKKARIEIAKKMKAKDYSIDTISEITGLSKEEIKNL